jgi:hypothetical protein
MVFSSRIFNSATDDPMLLDTVQGLRSLQDAFGLFLESPLQATSFTAQTDGSPEPHEEFLSGLRGVKGGETRLQVTSNRWLEISGTQEDLIGFRRCLAPTEGNHLHWYGKPVSLTIEADSCWSERQGLPT